MNRRKYRWEEVADHYGVVVDEMPLLMQRLLDKYETVERLVEHFNNDEHIEISRRTIDRFLAENDFEAFVCWRRRGMIFNGSFTATLRTPPIADAEGQGQP